jgi:hypothetical protein
LSTSLSLGRGRLRVTVMRCSGPRRSNVRRDERARCSPSRAFLPLLVVDVDALAMDGSLLDAAPSTSRARAP